MERDDADQEVGSVRRVPHPVPWTQGKAIASTARVERFTRVSPDILEYQFTIDDPTVWTRPWTAVQSLRKTEAPLFEYACHEGHYAMENMLAGARREEAQRR